MNIGFYVRLTLNKLLYMKIQPNIYLAIGVLTGSAMLISCYPKHDAQAQQQEVPELAVITVGEEDASLETGYPATLHGKNDVEIRPQISGFLTKVNVQEGQRVSAGQVLFTIDQVQLQAQVDAAKAAIAVAQANVNTAKPMLTTTRSFLKKT